MSCVFSRLLVPFVATLGAEAQDSEGEDIMASKFILCKMFNQGSRHSIFYSLLV